MDELPYGFLRHLDGQIRKLLTSWKKETNMPARKSREGNPILGVEAN
jgi:hypothetical protein